MMTSFLTELTAADLAPLVKAVRRNGVKVLHGYPWRFHPIAVAVLKPPVQELPLLACLTTKLVPYTGCSSADQCSLKPASVREESQHDCRWMSTLGRLWW